MSLSEPARRPRLEQLVAVFQDVVKEAAKLNTPENEEDTDNDENNERGTIDFILFYFAF